jgi:hypothetical protein
MTPSRDLRLHEAEAPPCAPIIKLYADYCIPRPYWVAILDKLPENLCIQSLCNGGVFLHDKMRHVVMVSTHRDRVLMLRKIKYGLCKAYSYQG